MKIRHALIPLCMASSVATAEVVWVPSLGFQMKTLDFEQEITGGLTPVEGDLSIDMPTAQLGMTALKGKYFVSFKLDLPLTDTATQSTVPYTNAYDDSVSPAFAGPASSSEVDREDMALTIGYSVMNNLNVFGGYMEGKTTITPDVTLSYDFNQGIPIPNLAWSMDSDGLGSYEQKYSEDGFFVGASYAVPVKDAGTLAFSFAYAQLDGEYQDNYTYLSGGIPQSDLDFEVDGDATGVSLAASWTASLTDRISYYFDVRQQQYKMDGEDANGNFPGLEIETTETIISFAAGLRYVL